MKFCPVVPDICRGQVHVPRKERKEEEENNNKIIIRNGAKTISLQTLFGRLNYDVSAEVIKNCVKYIFVGRCLLIFLTR